MTEQGMKQRRPFHEAIIDAIRRASSSELECLGTLIRATKIPKGHDEIIAAWQEKLHEFGWDDRDLATPADLLEQKQEAEKKEEEKKAKEQVTAAKVRGNLY